MEARLVYGSGDKVVHPAHGAGIVRKVVKRTIAGETHQYYLIEPLAYANMEIMVAVDKVERIGLRDASKRSRINRALRTLRQSPRKVARDYKKRRARISDKISSADPCRLAEVARDLVGYKREKGRLGTTDTRFLKQARESIAGELAVVENMTFDEALDRVDEALVIEESD